MKRKVNCVIMVLACATLVWGIIASCFTLATANPKTQTARYDKDGKNIVTYVVSASEEYRYVKSLDVELITRSEYYDRYAKNCKIIMNRAKEDYEADKTDERLSAYNQASASYKTALAEARNFDIVLFTNGSATFFGTYFPIIILLGIALLINTKIDYKRDKEKA